MKNSITALYKLLTAIISYFSGKTGSENQNVSVTELNEILSTDSSAVLIDLRNDSELVGNMQKLKEATHIPLPRLDDSLATLNKFKKRNIYFICHSGSRSMIATIKLRAKGFNSFNVKGGMAAYRSEH